MKTDYRHTLGFFDARGNFEGGRIVHRTARGEVEGTLLCQSIGDSAHEWFIVLGWPREHAASSQLLHLTRESNTPLSDAQLQSITRKPDGIFYLVEDEQVA